VKILWLFWRHMIVNERQRIGGLGGMKRLASVWDVPAKYLFFLVERRLIRAFIKRYLWLIVDDLVNTRQNLLDEVCSLFWIHMLLIDWFVQLNLKNNTINKSLSFQILTWNNAFLHFIQRSKRCSAATSTPIVYSCEASPCIMQSPKLVVTISRKSMLNWTYWLFRWPMRMFSRCKNAAFKPIE